MNPRMETIFLNRTEAKKIKHPATNQAIISISTPGDRSPWLSPGWSFVQTVVVHCDAGMSRSAAVASFIAKRYDCSMTPRFAPHANRTVMRLLKEQAFSDDLAKLFTKETK